MIFKEQTAEINRRILNLRTCLEENNLDAMLLCREKNVLYFSGLNTGRMLITEDEAILWVKDLYLKVHSNILSQRKYPIEARAYEKNAIRDYIKKTKKKEVGIENVSVLDYRKLEKDLKVRVTPTDFAEKLRATKSSYEITLLKKSAEIAKKAMNKAEEITHAGVNELEAAAELEAYIRKLGSETPPFSEGILYSSGASSADIHSSPQKKIIKAGELVVVDLGARYHGYYSDMTRTLSTEKTRKKEKDLIEDIENLELETIESLQPGLKASEVHGCVEKRINSMGYKVYHSTGHGIGLDVHELPNIGADSNDTLTEGMVFTIEPGIYVPKKFGIRFEDTVVLQKNKAEKLTR